MDREILSSITFCNRARKIAHHFAHTEQTCAAVANRKDLPLLPLYTKFGDLGRGALEELLMLWQEYGSAGHAAPKPSQSSLINLEYLRFNRFMGREGGYEFTKRGKLPVGGLSVPLFADVQQQHLIERLHQMEDRADDYLYYGQNDLFETVGDCCFMGFPQAMGDYRLYRAQLKRVLSQHLYYLKVQTTKACFYKIGVTSRSIEERLSEIRTEVGSLVSVLDITVLGLWQHCGRVEHYFKHRFREQNQPIGPLTEYFSFDEARAKKVLRELRRLKSKQTLSAEEQFVLSDDPMPLELQVEENIATYYQEIEAQPGPREDATRQIHPFLPFLLSLFSIFLFPRHDQLRSLASRPERASAMRASASAEMSQINHRVSQAFQGIVQLTDPFEAQQ